MKILLHPIHVSVYFALFCSNARCYDVSLSNSYLKIELHKWSNFTVHLEAHDNETSNQIIMEVNHTAHMNVSPKIVEINTKNFSSWCHMFHVYACKPGTSKIHLNFTNDSLWGQESSFYVTVDILRMKSLELYAGWCRKYFHVFSVLSGYPQIFMQFLRLSVVGLDMDYVCFNFIDNISNGVYAFFMNTQTDAFSERNPSQEFPVTLTENMLALHGLVLSVLLGLQAIRYYGVDKRLTVVGKELISFYGIIFTIGFLLAKFHIIQYLDFLYLSRYIHVASMSTKYLPQLYKNYIIKSTFGWNIWNSILEAIGCSCAIIYFLLTAYNYDDWMTMITNDFFWSSCAILLQHAAFIVQHYFIYEKWLELDLSEFHEITLEEKISLYEQRLEHC